VKLDSGFDDLIAGLCSCGLAIHPIPERISRKAADIHISADTPVKIYCTDGEVYTSCSRVLSAEDVGDLFYKLCDYSVYRHMKEIKDGYITVFGYYRCGIAGTANIKHGEVASVGNITSLNIRIPRHVPGAAEEIFRCKVDLLDGLLVVGEPSSGKTTILRDIVAHLEGKRCVVVDERRELTCGFDFHDVDILLDYDKKNAISQAIRCLSPKLILCDELDSADIPAIRQGMSSGVSFIASVHGSIDREGCLRPVIWELISTGAFRNIAVLYGREAPGKIREVRSAREFIEAYGGVDDNLLRPLNWPESKQKTSDKSIYAGRFS